MGANAQTSVWTFTAGQVLTAAQMNDTARTGVPVFATTTTRDAAFGGTGEKTLAEGQMCYIETAPKRLQVYNGTAWVDYDTAYIAFTPTLTNLTLGNGTLESGYVRLGKFVHYVGSIVFGSTSAMGVSPTISLPVSSNMLFPGNMGVGHLFDATGGINPAIFYSMTSTTVQIAIQDAGGVFVAGTYIDFARPFTWAVNDVITWNLTYRAA